MNSRTNNVFLNHVYAVIDEDTYNEINNSDFLKNEFCHCQEQTQTNEKMSWTGFYMTGENTYIEFFNYKEKKHLQEIKIGRIGIACGIDRKEEIEKIIELFKQKFAKNINHGVFKKNIENNLVPWFYFVEVTNDSSMMPELDTWVMAYHKDYFDAKNIKISGENSLTRKEYNKQSITFPFDKNKLFRDIEEITLLLNDAIKTKFIERQTLLGYTCQEAKDCTICRGPGIIFILKPSIDQTCKLLTLQMSLNRKVNKPQIYKIGNSTIELENENALWTFK